MGDRGTLKQHRFIDCFQQSFAVMIHQIDRWSRKDVVKMPNFCTYDRTKLP